jgi:hypothetical protein
MLPQCLIACIRRPSRVSSRVEEEHRCPTLPQLCTYNFFLYARLRSFPCLLAATLFAYMFSLGGGSTWSLACLSGRGPLMEQLRTCLLACFPWVVELPGPLPTCRVGFRLGGRLKQVANLSAYRFSLGRSLHTTLPPPASLYNMPSTHRLHSSTAEQLFLSAVLPDRL